MGNLWSTVPGCEEDPRVISYEGASLGELMVELGLGEGEMWVLLPLSAW